MKRYLVTISDDNPTLAAQAHAAIVAVQGVVGVEPARSTIKPGPARLYDQDLLDAPPTYTVGDEEDGE